MDLSTQFKYCNSIEDLFRLVKWRDFKQFNSRLRIIHSCMNQTDVYDTFWDIMYKISTFSPIDITDRNSKSSLFMSVDPKDFPYICAYCRDAYDTLGYDLLKKPSKLNIYVYYSGIVLLMLSFDDESWTSRVDNDFATQPYYLEQMLDLFCVINETFGSAKDVDDYIRSYRKIGNGDLLRVRNIITQFANGLSKPNADDLFGCEELGPNEYETVSTVLQSIAKYYTVPEYRIDVLSDYFNKYLPIVSRRTNEIIVYEQYKEDFAWEAGINDGMIYMMDHVTYAYSTFPRKEKRLTQEIIDTYIDDLVNYVYSTSKMVNRGKFFGYIRDILNLVIPRVGDYPDTRIYIDAALAKVKMPDAIPTETENPQPAVMATESIINSSWYKEMHEFAMEAKRPPDEDEEDYTDEEEDEIGSSGPIQKKSSANKKSSVAENDASRKIYAAWKKTQKNRGRLNKSLGIIGEGLKKCLVGDVTSAVIDGKKVTPIEALCRILGTGAIFLVGGPLPGIIATVVQYAAKKTCLNSERKKILLDLERELEIIEEKIDDAKGDGNKQAKYALMRTRNDLKSAIERIKYNISADNRGAADTAKAIVKGKNRRGGFDEE